MEHHLSCSMPAVDLCLATSFTCSLCWRVRVGGELRANQVPNESGAGQGGPSCWSCANGPRVCSSAGCEPPPLLVPLCRLPQPGTLVPDSRCGLLLTPHELPGSLRGFAPQRGSRGLAPW